jgi:hypothetical protein
LKELVPLELIEKKIYLVRGQKVMLDRDLADLYGVETRALNQAVRRNICRFPYDFMLSLDREEIERISQIVISSAGRKDTLKFSKNVRYLQGVAMLSSVLNSKKAVQVNIAIMRTFVKLREMMASQKDLARKLEALEKKYDGQFQIVFEAIRLLMAEPEPKEKKIGFIVKEQRAAYKTARKR